MYGSYGSYSSTSAMDIPSRSNTYHSSTHHDASCAFPSWPRRDSLTNDTHVPHASSYISDEDLLFSADSVFADDDNSSESSSCGTPSPTLAPAVMHISEEDIEELRREQAVRQREYMTMVMREKEQRRRRQADKRKKAAGAASRKAVSPKSKLSAMTPIAEAME